MDVSCRNTNQSVGNILTQSNFLTLKYVTDSWGTDSHGFKLVITAIKNISEWKSLTRIYEIPQFSSSILKYFCYVIHCLSSFFPSHITDHACKELSCLSSEFCISTDLMCDNINHCGDGSDESSHLCCVYILHVWKAM